MSTGSPSYRLSYFDIPGKAETARILFRLAKVPFEDQRFPFSKDAEGKVVAPEWKAVKPSYVYEQVPVLFTEGFEIPQSAAINRFLARRFGFWGSNDIEAALIDAAVDQFVDVKQAYFKIRDQPSEVEKFYDNQFKDLFRLLARQMEKFKPSEGHFIGSKLSLVDILIWQLPQLGNEEKFKSVLVQFPTIKAIYDNVDKLDGVRPPK